MAKTSLEIVDVLRRTARKIETSADYQWGHMGACNCGFLAQEITHLRKEEIHNRAMQRYGDWNEQLNDYCPTSGLPMDNLISAMLKVGFSADDLKHLEKLSDTNVIDYLPDGERHLKYNQRSDVVKYMRTWAHQLEQEATHDFKLPAFTTKILSPEPEEALV